MSLEYDEWRKNRRVIGACDICNAQKVEIAMGYVSGIQTFYCAEGCPENLPKTAAPITAEDRT